MRDFDRGGLVLLVLSCALGVLGFAEVPLSEQTSQEIVVVRTRVEQWISTAETALETGLASIAERVFAQVLQELPEADSRRQDLRLKWVSALLATGNLEAAEKGLAEGPVPDAPEWKLRQAMLDLALGQRASAVGRLQELKEADLPSGDRCWLLYVRGVLDWDAGDQEAGLALMERAVGLAQFPAQRSQMELAVYQRRVFAGPISPDFLEDLRKKTEAFKGQRAGFQFARELALALQNLGQRNAALEVLEKHLALLVGSEGRERSQFLFLIGLLSAKESGRGLLALQELVRGGGERKPLLLGLHLLLLRWPDDAASQGKWIAFLEDVLEFRPEHPLRGELLLLLAQAAFEQKEIERSRLAADAYLKGFPQAENAPDALRLLASISLSIQPPQYRTAASFLSRIRDKSKSGQERFLLGVQLADCHFLAGDYENAATLYETSIEEVPEGHEIGVLAFQHVLALLQGGDLEGAKSVLDKLDPETRGFADHRWRAEWNLITRLKGAGRAGEAFSRVRDILKSRESQPKEGLPVNLTLRLQWLEAHLALEVGRPSETSQNADNLLEALKTASEDMLEEKEAENLLAGALLLKVQALLALKKYKEAVPFIRRLREEHPGTGFAQRSYLLEASYHYQADDLVKAQQLSVELADLFPENPLAPIALMEAAQFAEKRGSEKFDKAHELLERLYRQYPNHELVFYARLRQGHLFRKSNQFGTAQQIYANLVNQFPEHPETHLALLASADCQLAQAGDDAVRFEVAINLLERLFLQPDLHPDISVEAGYKLAFAHRQTGNSVNAQEVLGSSLDRFLLNPKAGTRRLGGRGRYWMSRSILELGTLLEEGRVPDEARIVYGLIEENNLPGRNLANSRMEQLGI